MSFSNLLRWSGLAAMVGGALFVISELLDLYNFSGAVDEENFSEVAATAPWVAEALLYLLGTVLLLFGLFGLYARQSEAAGHLGLVGFLVAFLGTALVAGVSWGDVFVVPIRRPCRLRTLQDSHVPWRRDRGSHPDLQS